MQFVGYTIIVCSYVGSTLYALLQMMIPLLLYRQQGEEPTKRHMGCGTAGETSMPPLQVWMLLLGCLSIATVHGACDRPRCLRVVNSGIHAPHPRDLRGVIIKPPKLPTILNFKHLKHLGPCRQRALSSLESKTVDLNSTILLAITAAFLAEVIMYLSSSSVIGKCSNSCAACEIRLQFCIAGANESGHQIRL